MKSGLIVCRQRGRRLTRVLVAALAILEAGCSGETKSPERASSSPTASPFSAPAAAAAQAALARMDPRAPDVLTPAMAWQQKQRMMAFLAAVEQVIGGAAADDWEAVARAAETLGTSPQTKQSCDHRPSNLDSISAMALEFRCRADGIGVAARAHKPASVLRATADTLGACNGCHAAFRQNVVDENTWHASQGVHGSSR